jgi:hypothetical protein
MIGRLNTSPKPLTRDILRAVNGGILSLNQDRRTAGWHSHRRSCLTRNWCVRTSRTGYVVNHNIPTRSGILALQGGEDVNHFTADAVRSLRVGLSAYVPSYIRKLEWLKHLGKTGRQLAGRPVGRTATLPPLAGGELPTTPS